MKMHRYFLMILLLQISASNIFGQVVTLTEGSFSNLLAEKTIRLRFTYDSMQVGKYKKEQDYVDKKIAEINKKYPGKGDTWASNWISQRKLLFEPAFTNAFITASGKDTALTGNYTLIFNTSFIEQGFSSAAILVHKNPEVRGELILVKSDDHSSIIARAYITKAMGKAGPHFETGEHVDAAYDEAGRGAGAFIVKK